VVSYRCTERPRDEWIPISVPPIIDLETFQRAGRQGRDNQAFAPRNLKAQAYLLRKLVRCGGCGSSCSARTSQQTYGGTIHSSHYYACLRKHSGFLKQERCAQRHIRADVLDDMVWEEVSTRLRDPALLLEACRDREAQSSNAEQNRLMLFIPLNRMRLSATERSNAKMQGLRRIRLASSCRRVSRTWCVRFSTPQWPRID